MGGPRIGPNSWSAGGCPKTVAGWRLRPTDAWEGQDPRPEVLRRRAPARCWPSEERQTCRPIRQRPCGGRAGRTRSNTGCPPKSRLQRAMHRPDSSRMTCSRARLRRRRSTPMASAPAGIAPTATHLEEGSGQSATASRRLSVHPARDTPCSRAVPSYPGRASSRPVRARRDWGRNTPP